MKKFIKSILIITIVAFIFQLSWEYFQCGIFYALEEIGSKEHFLLMTSATLGDIMMTIVLYGLLALVNHDLNWYFKKWEIKEYVIITLYALFMSFYFEISALYTGRWAYSNLMPLFPNTNIGLIPVIQLLLLFPLTFYIAKIITKKFFS